MSTLGLALILTPVFVLIAITRNNRRRSEVRAATIDVHADAAGVHRVLADGRREEIEWDEVTQVEVFTARVGPHKGAGGAVVLFGDETRGCIIPLDKLADSHLLDHVTRLPGLSLSKLVEATTHEERDRDDPHASVATYFKPKPLQTTFVVWRRPTDDGAVAGEPADGATGGASGGASGGATDDPAGA